MTGSAQARPVVLVAEDDPILRMAAVDMVRDAGFEALEATDIAHAVGILETRPDIAILFTDVDMPRGTDGLAVALLIRDRWPPIGLVITSGKLTPRQDELPARGVFFAKPYREQAVVAAIRRMAA